MGLNERTNTDSNPKPTIKDFESTYPELAKEFSKVQEEQYELFAGKMMDYGLGNIALGSILVDGYLVAL